MLSVEFLFAPLTPFLHQQKENNFPLKSVNLYDFEVLLEHL